MTAFHHTGINEIPVALILPDGASYYCCVRTIAERRLEHVEAAQWFALGGIGVAGTTSKEELVFRTLLHEPNAAGKLKALLSEANLAGQCYALLGLYVLHDAAYEENVARYKSNDARVKTVAGCSITEQPVSSVVSNIAAGRYDGMLKDPVH
jgi:hypothetical protein